MVWALWCIGIYGHEALNSAFVPVGRLGPTEGMDGPTTHWPWETIGGQLPARGQKSMAGRIGRHGMMA